MDYEKKYKEVLERAKELLNKQGITVGSYPNREAIETIFPELAESEDERIRKELIEYHKRQFENNRDQEVGLFHKDALAYLEKQKEQKPMYNLEIPAGDVAPAEEDGPFDEDEFLENELSAFLQNYDKEYDDDAAVSDVARHFYEIGKKQKEQEPEWSEEDEEKLEQCIRIVGGWEVDYDIVKSPYSNFLKSLRPQYHGYVTMTEAYKMGLEAGKASSWKPSEEQMEALERASTNKYLSAKQFDILVSLHEDLNKL